MSKGKEDEDVNPFGGFNILKGEFEPPIIGPEDTAEVTTDSDTVIQDNPEPVQDDTMSLADKKLQELSDAKAAGKKVSPVITGSDIDEPEEDTEDTAEASLFKTFVKDLYDKGVVEFDDTDPDFEDSPEGLAKIVQKTISKAKEDEKAKKHPDLQKLEEFVENGGDPKTFLDVYYGNHSWETFDIESEDAQKLAVAESLRLAGESEEDIEDMITEWNDNGSLAKRAKSALTKLQKNEVVQKESIVEQQRIAAENQRKANEEFWNNFKADLDKKEDIMGFKVTPKIKEKLWNFMTVVDKRSGKTEYQKALEDKKDSALLFALQAMNNFDVTSLEKQVKTKVSNEMQHLLKNYSKSSKDKISSGRSDENYGSNPFEAFRNAK